DADGDKALSIARHQVEVAVDTAAQQQPGNQTADQQKRHGPGDPDPLFRLLATPAPASPVHIARLVLVLLEASTRRAAWPGLFGLDAGRATGSGRLGGDAGRGNGQDCRAARAASAAAGVLRLGLADLPTATVEADQPRCRRLTSGGELAAGDGADLAAGG